MTRGNPRCPDCNGKGVIRVGRGWRSCVCVRGTAESARLNHYANSIGTDPDAWACNLRKLRGEDATTNPKGPSEH